MNDSRDIAYRVLTAHESSQTRVADLLSRYAEKCDRDVLRLASEIIYTTVRRRATLDAIISSFVKRPREQVERDLWILLRIGACQLVLLEVASHAAVHETIEACRRSGHRRWIGFLNGTLRAIERAVIPEAEAAVEPAAASVPLSGSRGRRLKRDVFADPATEFTRYVAQAYSYPQWLIDRWVEQRDRSEVLHRAAWFNDVPGLTLRVNQLKTDRPSLLSSLVNGGVSATEGDLPDAIRLLKRAVVHGLPGFAEGHFAVQDESAMAASVLLDPRPGQRVLDLCAGSGSKSCHLAALMQNTGEVVAVDTSANRLVRLAENTQRLGVSIVTAVHGDATAPDVTGEGYDAVLVDVPCSNTGVLGKRPEVRWRLRPDELPELVRLQLRMLESAVRAARPGGRIVYSTCSCEPDENQLLVGAFLRLHQDVTLISEHCHVPGQPGDGAYQALLSKTD